MQRVTRAKRALYDNLGKDEALALSVDSVVRENLQDDWRGNAFKVKKVKLAIKPLLEGDEERAVQILELAKNQHEY